MAFYCVKQPVMWALILVIKSIVKGFKYQHPAMEKTVTTQEIAANKTDVPCEYISGQ